MMPIDLVLVRHGQSEGNVATKRSKKGDHSAFSEAFRRRHSSQWRLTDVGIEEARIAGQWLKEHMGGVFDRYYTSEYVRAKETAGHLGLPHAHWYCDFNLRERDRGDIDTVSQDELREKYFYTLIQKELDALYWCPPNGESMAQLCRRIDRVIETLHRECESKRVIIVCHGEVMWAFRIRLERMTQKRYGELDRSKNPHDYIHNTQVLHYSRRVPEHPEEITRAYEWMRSICPTNTALSSNVWQPIVRPVFTNEDLLQDVGSVPRLVNE